MNKIQVVDIVEGTSVDGPGLRTTIYCAGCVHRCPGCHNPQTWDCKQGQSYSVDRLMGLIKEADLDVTFSGGDPMFAPEGFAELADRIHDETDKNIWCYTGYTFEEILQDRRRRVLLERVDVLVDGKFEADRRQLGLRFRGSDNQRIIDVHRSLKENRAVLFVDDF